MFGRVCESKVSALRRNYYVIIGAHVAVVGRAMAARCLEQRLLMGYLEPALDGPAAPAPAARRARAAAGSSGRPSQDRRSERRRRAALSSELQATSWRRAPLVLRKCLAIAYAARWRTRMQAVAAAGESSRERRRIIASLTEPRGLILVGLVVGPLGRDARARPSLEHHVDAALRRRAKHLRVHVRVGDRPDEPTEE